MKNKSTLLASWVAILTTIGILAHIYEITICHTGWTWHFSLWLIPIAYTVFLYSADNIGSIWKQHVKLFSAAISVFKKKF